GLGFQVAIRETAGQPLVLAHHPGTGAGASAGDRPHLLFYGHYDVQPPEPLELWTSPPFEPAIVDGPHGKRVVARGAVDDKGQASMWLGALRAWVEETGGLPVPVTVLIEGEEEIGSPSLDPFLAAHRDELRADVAVISDTATWNIDTPAITTQLRGLVYLEVRLKAAARDLHSGLFGGAARNAVNTLARALAALHDDNGRVTVPGFYDGVADLSAEQRAEWAALHYDESAFLGTIGLRHPAGETDREGLERRWARPTCDVNGIWGGYAGPGAKTVIAAEAGAKVSFRLVPGQDPEAIVASFKRHMTSLVPDDVRLEFDQFASGRAIQVPRDSRFVQAARTVMAEEYGRPAVLIGSGGSIPVVESLKRLLGLDSLLLGFGLDDDQTHSPNEKFEVRCFRHGMRTHARLLGHLGGA
ncbi:MAG TPA: M20/M25/M40 family metallo-hydrolase, partial [Acetobacteraceae bacterium]|nr:M20/M25/M40 family metallo-hydrolase [Acetobacteraceae bacterium]